MTVASRDVMMAVMTAVRTVPDVEGHWVMQEEVVVGSWVVMPNWDEPERYQIPIFELSPPNTELHAY